MNNNNSDFQLQLINTTFTAKDALEVLIDLIDHKINFHKCKRLSNELKQIKGEEYASRIATLKEEKKRLVSFYESIDETQNIYVNGMVQLQLVNSTIEQEA